MWSSNDDASPLGIVSDETSKTPVFSSYRRVVLRSQLQIMDEHLHIDHSRHILCLDCLSEVGFKSNRSDVCILTMTASILAESSRVSISGVWLRCVPRL